MSDSTKPRVLIIAEAANPEWVSVPLVGWSLANALREVAHVHLVTHERNREAILRFGLVEGADFTAVNSDALVGPLLRVARAFGGKKGKGWTALTAATSLAYPYFEHLVWRQFSERIRAGEFDIVHRITPLSPTAPSSMAKKCFKAGVPFVLGPLNGGVPWPKEFAAERRAEKEWLSYVRSAYKLLPGRAATLKFASAILVASRFTESEIPKKSRDKCIYMPENGIDPGKFSKHVPKLIEQKPMRACFIGRMVPYKGPDMLLEAAEPLLQSGALHLDMIGDGPLLPQLKELCAKKGLCDAVTFHGWLAHDRVQDVASQSSLLTLPSIREFGGGVVLEALAMGLAPVIVDYAGPSELVKLTSGFLVPMGSRAEIIRSLEKKLRSLVANPDLVSNTGERGREAVLAAFTWPQKAKQIAEVYDWQINGRSARPSLFWYPNEPADTLLVESGS